jgi:MYXO-CTERM domain-containing protein
VNPRSAIAPALSTLALVALLPLRAEAAPPVVDNFDNFEMRQLAGFQDVGYDTGWLPAGSPVQLRIEFQAANTVQISMFGEGRYDWDEERVHFVGNENGGNFLYDVGLLVHAEVQADVVGFTWGSDILGPFDYLIEAETDFDPYLLLGNEDRPAIVDDAADGATIASIPLLPDIIIASGNLDIDLSYEVHAELESDSILVEGPIDMASVVMEGEQVPITPDEVDDWTEPLPVDATLMAHVTTSTTVIIRPHLVMEILGMPYDIAGIDIPVALPEMNDSWIFETKPLNFERPEPPVDPMEGGEGTGEDGGDAQGESGESSASGSGQDEVGTDDGCNCNHDPREGPPFAPSLLGLLLLPLVRRRRP